MPLVLITRRSSVTDEEMLPLVDGLPQIVADQLTAPGDELGVSDITVKVQEASTLDRNIRDVAVIIFAGEYPERLNTLDERRAHIVKKMRELLPERVRGYLWILLQPSNSFEEW